MIEVLTAGPLATVQDLGRTGALNLGVGTSGAMDPLALAAGNILLGNDEGAAAVEIPVFPFRVRFASSTVFAVTGADCALPADFRCPSCLVLAAPSCEGLLVATRAVRFVTETCCRRLNRTAVSSTVSA